MLLKELAALRAPSGLEDEARAAIRREAEEILKDRGEVFADTMGNLYAVRKGTDANKRRVMLCAHMDEPGFIVRFATEEGLIKFDTVGRPDPRALICARVQAGKDAVPGVIGCKAVHLMTEAEEKAAPTVDSLSIDVGASSREEAERLCPKGTYATADVAYREFGDGFVKMKAIGSRAGCMILLDALRGSDYAGDLICAFTVQKEVGLRGAKVAAKRVKPDAAIVIDAVCANDMGDTKVHMQGTQCGKGAAVACMDRGMVADRPLRELALAVAAERDIPAQLSRQMGGGTDAGAIHLAQAGVPCLSLGIPCRYADTPANVAKLTDIDAARRLTLAVLSAM